MDGGANNRIFINLHAEEGDKWYFHVKNQKNLKITLSKQEAPTKKGVQFLLPTDWTRNYSTQQLTDKHLDLNDSL
mgnify:CR=1 FL=1